jgi:hypothetical protein
MMGLIEPPPWWPLGWAEYLLLGCCAELFVAAVLIWLLVHAIRRFHPLEKIRRLLNRIPSAPETPWEERLAQANVLLVNSSAIGRYLDAHQDLKALAPAICQRLREEFGTQAQLSLLWKEDGGEECLLLNVRPETDDRLTRERIQVATRPFDELLQQTSGRFLITAGVEGA